MLTRSEVQLDLLQKLNELCEKANVKYVLHGQAAYLAYFNQPFNQVKSLEVLMCQGDAEKIFDLLDDDKYYFEDFRTNPKFDRQYMMFGLKESIDLKNKDLIFNSKRHIDNHCIRINIHFILRSTNKFARKVINTNRKVSKVRNMEASTDFNNFRKKKEFVNRVFKFINDDFYNKSIYVFKNKTISIDSWDDIKKYPLIKIAGKKAIESNIFDSISKVSIGGVSSYILKDFETYATHFYGRNWEEKKWPSVNRFTSTLIGWEEFSEDPQVKEIIEGIENRYVTVYEKALKTVKYRDTIREMRKQVIQSKRVVYTREETLQQKDNIIELYHAGNMEELEEIFAPLTQSMKFGINCGYTYSVDEEIDSIFDSYLRETDRGELADKIKELRVDV